ncbi:MAG: transcription antitermination factor NusB [Rhodospirillales bacterium]
MAKNAPAGKRSAARLAAVQALYQLDISGGRVGEVVREFIEHRLGRELDGEQYAGADEELFKALVEGAAAAREELDNMIAAVLPETWPLDRLESILRQILRCGVFELAEQKLVPAPVVISEYVGVADAFYAGKEPGMVNAVLDRLARDLRPGEGKRAETPRTLK